jgi:hypothetical protein
MIDNTISSSSSVTPRRSRIRIRIRSRIRIRMAVPFSRTLRHLYESDDGRQ